MFVLYVVMTGYNIQAIPGFAPSSSAQYQQVQELQQQLQRQQEEASAHHNQHLHQHHDLSQERQQKQVSASLGVTKPFPAQQGSVMEFVSMQSSTEMSPKIHPEECIAEDVVSRKYCTNE